MSVRVVLALVVAVALVLGGGLAAVTLFDDDGTQARTDGSDSTDGGDGGGVDQVQRADVSATAVADGRVRLAFDDVDNGTDEYVVRRRTENASTSVVATVPDDDSSGYAYTDTHTEDGTEYVYAVVARGDGERLGRLGEASATADATPPVVSTGDGFVAVGQMADREVEIAFQSTERLGGITVTVGGAEDATLGRAAFTETATGNGTYTYNATYAGRTDGRYEVTLSEVADVAGNVNATASSESVDVDATPPGITSFDLSKTFLNEMAVTVNSTERLDDLSVRLTNTDTGENVTFTEADFTATERDGTYTYRVGTQVTSFGTYRARLVTAEDAAGNGFGGIYADRVRYTGE